ncbi:MAG: NADH-quinone oxidoreductase subunit J [Bacteroidota bacterium]
MPIETILFFLFSLVAAVSAVIMITRANPLMSAIFLIINFFSLAGLYLLLNAQFISVAQVIVYTGAIMVLFLFVLMLLNFKSEESILSTRRAVKILAIAVAAVVFLQLAYIIMISAGKSSSAVRPDSLSVGTIEHIGNELYVHYIIPFEISGFLLLAATIGALVLAKKKFE